MEAFMARKSSTFTNVKLDINDTHSNNLSESNSSKNVSNNSNNTNNTNNTNTSNGLNNSNGSTSTNSSGTTTFSQDLRNRVDNRKINNREFWKEEEEQILRDWADKAQCYELMHAKSHDIFNYRNTLFVIPVIIISTITGTANFAQDRVPESSQAIFVMVVGAFNILAAIISTIAQYLKISELNESHRVGTLQWGKFYRNIRTELSKHPLDRVPPTNMLSMCKEEFDRLLEIYPDIPKRVIEEFNEKFKNKKNISKPEICDVIEATTVYKMSKADRIDMIKMINEIVDPEPEPEPAPIIIETVKGTEPEPEPSPEPPPMIGDFIIDEEASKKIDKFRQTFFKINNRLPTDEEIKESIHLMFNNEQVLHHNLTTQDNNTHNSINMGNSSTI